MFRGYGVGLTVTDISRAPVPSSARDGVVDRPSRLHEVLTVSDRSDAEIALELGRLQALKAQLAAYEASLVIGLAEHRPHDGMVGEGPVPGTSEFFVDELALVCNTTTNSAGRLASQSSVLVERLSPVHAALADGELDWPRARVFIDVLATTAAGVAEAVGPRVLPAASGLSLGRLRARLAREALAEDSAAAEQRRADAERSTDVRLRPTANGMSELAVEMPSPLSAACWSTVDELAWMVKNDGDPRPIGQLRAGVLADLILRPWDTSRPTVTANLTVVAPLDSLTGAGDLPAEVHEQPITAAHVRELLAQLDEGCLGGVQATIGGSLQIAVTDSDGRLLAATDRRELARIARRGCPEHASADCACPVLAQPEAVDRYRPTPAQYRFTKLRDRTCRQPGCSRSVGRVDLDHVHPFGDGGATDCDNLCCLCRGHHRLKTHAPGWRFVLTDHGVLRVTTPSGITRTTRPPGVADRIEQRSLPGPPPAPPEPPPF